MRFVAEAGGESITYVVHVEVERRESRVAAEGPGEEHPPLWPNVIAVQIEALQCHVHLGPSG